MFQKRIVVEVVDEYWGIYSEMQPVTKEYVFHTARKAWAFAREQAEIIGRAGSRRAGGLPREGKADLIAREGLEWRRRKLILKGME